MSVPRALGIGLPRGSFSALELLEKQKESGVEGRVVLRDQGSPRIPDPSLLLLCKRRQHLEQPWPIFWSRHRNARLVGASLALINDQRELCQEATYGKRRVQMDRAWQEMVFGEPVELKGPWTSLVSNWFPTDVPQPFAHWLLDALPRLGVLKEFPPETRIILPGWKARYQVEAMQLLGLAERCRWTREKHLRIEDYYFSAPTSMVVCHNPYAVQFLRSSFLSVVPRANTPRKFFVRRTSFGRNMVNEEEVYAFFRELGWEIVDTAALKIAEQIQWFSGAEAVCAIHGSGTANMVWCQAGCKFVELFCSDYLAGDQEWISQCVNVDYSFMIFPSDHRMNARVDLSALRTHLQSIGVI